MVTTRAQAKGRGSNPAQNAAAAPNANPANNSNSGNNNGNMNQNNSNGNGNANPPNNSSSNQSSGNNNSNATTTSIVQSSSASAATSTSFAAPSVTLATLATSAVGGSNTNQSSGVATSSRNGQVVAPPQATRNGPVSSTPIDNSQAPGHDVPTPALSSTGSNSSRKRRRDDENENHDLEHASHRRKRACVSGVGSPQGDAAFAGFSSAAAATPTANNPDAHPPSPPSSGSEKRRRDVKDDGDEDGNDDQGPPRRGKRVCVSKTGSPQRIAAPPASSLTTIAGSSLAVAGSSSAAATDPPDVTADAPAVVASTHSGVDDASSSAVVTSSSATATDSPVVTTADALAPAPAPSANSPVPGTISANAAASSPVAAARVDVAAIFARFRQAQKPKVSSQKVKLRQGRVSDYPYRNNRWHPLSSALPPGRTKSARLDAAFPRPARESAARGAVQSTSQSAAQGASEGTDLATAGPSTDSRPHEEPSSPALDLINSDRAMFRQNQLRGPSRQQQYGSPYPSPPASPRRAFSISRASGNSSAGSLRRAINDHTNPRSRGTTVLGQLQRLPSLFRRIVQAGHRAVRSGMEALRERFGAYMQARVAEMQEEWGPVQQPTQQGVGGRDNFPDNLFDPDDDSSNPEGSTQSRRQNDRSPYLSPPITLEQDRESRRRLNALMDIESSSPSRQNRQTMSQPPQGENGRYYCPEVWPSDSESDSEDELPPPVRSAHPSARRKASFSTFVASNSAANPGLSFSHRTPQGVNGRFFVPEYSDDDDDDDSSSNGSFFGTGAYKQ